jgi:hypothetical protein
LIKNIEWKLHALLTSLLGVENNLVELQG